jgi:SAM-dependent methyltransferase
MHDAPFYPAAEQNREPILAVLRRVLVEPGLVLEIGSGSGQHAVHFAAQLPHLEWQPTDLPELLPGIDRWRALTKLANVRPPLALDLNDDTWPVDACTEAYSANTAHILSWVLVERMLAGVARRLRPGGHFCLYGPFRYGDRHTSESNATFDAALRRDDPQRGVRDAFRLEEYGLEVGLVLGADHAMPVNNRLLVFERRPD